ncbi:MAG: M48 family metallopeptidase, partial [Candidatus Kapabacteria bacterium]|nr:M48 family metallopeptidase [Candidatus Kapabacteria bacterium]
MSAVSEHDRYIITRKRVKNARITIKPDATIRVSIPWHMPKSDVEKFLSAHHEWIQRTLAKIAVRERVAVSPGTLLLHGKEYRFISCDGDSHTIVINHDETTVTGNPSMLSNQYIIEEWYKQQAAKYFTVRVAELAAQHGFTYSKIRISSATSKWGSCSSKGTISLHWKLIKTPVAVSDYLILHELVHTQHFNHSDSFWKRL